MNSRVLALVRPALITTLVAVLLVPCGCGKSDAADANAKSGTPQQSAPKVAEKPAGSIKQMAGVWFSSESESPVGFEIQSDGMSKFYFAERGRLDAEPFEAKAEMKEKGQVQFMVGMGLGELTEVKVEGDRLTLKGLSLDGDLKGGTYLRLENKTVQEAYAEAAQARAAAANAESERRRAEIAEQVQIAMSKIEAGDIVIERTDGSKGIALALENVRSTDDPTAWEADGYVTSDKGHRPVKVAVTIRMNDLTRVSGPNDPVVSIIPHQVVGPIGTTVLAHTLYGNGSLQMRLPRPTEASVLTASRYSIGMSANKARADEIRAEYAQEDAASQELLKPLYEHLHGYSRMTGTSHSRPVAFTYEFDPDSYLVRIRSAQIDGVPSTAQPIDESFRPEIFRDNYGNVYLRLRAFDPAGKTSKSNYLTLESESSGRRFLSGGLGNTTVRLDPPAEAADE